MNRRLYALGRLKSGEMNEMFEYRSHTGELVWKPGHGSNFSGKVAGAKHSRGYVQVNVNGRLLLAHRIVWAMHYGECPGVIDHINGIKSDNRIENLRIASAEMNMENIRAPRGNSSSGYLGVHKAHGGRWHAKIQVRGKCVYLGVFTDPKDAHAAYLEAKRRMHGGCTI